MGMIEINLLNIFSELNQVKNPTNNNRKMKLNYKKTVRIFLFILFLTNLNIFASHIAGGEISYDYLGGNKYQVTLKFYRDCSGIDFPNPAGISIYNSAGQLVQTVSASLGPVISLPANPPSPCTSIPQGICIEMATYTTTVTLPPIPGGYQIEFKENARNSGIINGPAGFSAYSATIPDVSLAAVNSNPKFKSTPPIFICAGSPFSSDNSATDADGDSLVYSLCSPLESVVPYTPYPFTPPYTATNPMGGSISMNPVTGSLTGIPNTIGKFVVGVCVTEYRKGKFLSTTTRDFQFSVVNCVSLSTASGLSALTNCNSHEVTFFNNSTGASGYLWRFGDGQTSTSASPVHIYPAIGTYTAVLIAYTSNPLCKDSTTIIVNVDPCRPCGMNVSAVTTPADCGVGGCGKITWTVPCTSCSNITVNKCGSGASISIGGSCAGSVALLSACPAGVLCGGTDVSQIPGATSTFVPGNSCSCSINVVISGTNRIISYCTNKPVTLGTATVTVNGGVGPYTYGWSPGGSKSATATGLSAGVYTVIVKDANGCVEVKSVPISGKGSITLSASKTDITGCGLSNGTASVIPSNGSGNYTYLWSPGGQTTSAISGLAAGIYTVMVNDASGCPSSATVTVNDVVNINVAVTSTDAACSNSSDGFAGAIPSGGATPYVYSWNTTPVQTTASATGLPKGFYMVQVTDANGCTGTKAITLNAPGPLVPVMSTVSPACFNSKNGTATIGITGGTPGYSYVWSTNAANQTGTVATGLTGGETYAVTVTDSKSCTGKGVIYVPRPSAINHDIIDRSAVNCSGVFDGKAEDIVSGGTPGYTYIWSPGGATTSLAGNLVSGIQYAVTIKDANNCSVIDTITVFNKGPLKITTSSTETCGSTNSGSATVLPTGGNTPYSYLWNPGTINSQTLVGLAAGTAYTVTVTDGNGCTMTSSVTINSSPALVLDKTVTGCMNNAAIDLSVSGGTTPYIYSWLGGQTTEDVSGLSPNTYNVTVWDANNCFDTLSVIVPVIPCQPSVMVTGDSVCPGGCKLLSAVVSQGKPPFTYLWNPGASTGTTLNVCSGTSQVYTVTITDISGATSTDTALVAFRPQPVINVAPATICAGASAVLTANGASTYVWAPSSGLSSTSGSSVNANPFVTTTYTVTGSDSKGCVAVTTVNLTVNSLPVINVSNAAVCMGSAATLTAAGAVTYTWAPPAGLSATTGAVVSATPLTSTTYTVTGTNADGCSAAATAGVVVNPAQVTPLDPHICPGQSYTLGNGTVVTNPGIYIDTLVSKMSGCDSIVITTLTVNIPAADAGNDVDIFNTFSTQLVAAGGTVYSWTPPDGLSCTNCPNPVAAPDTTTIYYVRVTDAYGCESFDSVKVTVKEYIPCNADADINTIIPNAFTPNGDGLNDELCIPDNICIRKISLKIFDRWGEKVYESSDPEHCWNGVYIGKELNTAVFAYYLTIEYLSGKTDVGKGNISLIR
ncbi:MAG: gliding motility-associated C-terminal domain-containing protein [Bacteroidetes bacterium]|nr:gliding motility-associated C-terminal domain-containing protein [Bacteroidota bacterium]